MDQLSELCCYHSPHPRGDRDGCCGETPFNSQKQGCVLGNNKTIYDLDTKKPCGGRSSLDTQKPSGPYDGLLREESIFPSAAGHKSIWGVRAAHPPPPPAIFSRLFKAPDMDSGDIMDLFMHMIFLARQTMYF